MDLLHLTLPETIYKLILKSQKHIYQAKILSQTNTECVEEDQSNFLVDTN